MKSLIFSFLMLICLCSNSQNAEVDKQKKAYNLTNGSLAIAGYDVISYYTGKPKMGTKNLANIHNGITYYFSSQTNLDLFKKSPEKFEPAYGGWCAYAMGSTGEKVEVDPATYKIVEGKLYLFYNAYFNNTLPKWNKDEKNLKNKADKNWLIIYK